MMETVILNFFSFHPFFRVALFLFSSFIIFSFYLFSFSPSVNVPLFRFLVPHFLLFFSLFRLFSLFFFFFFLFFFLFSYSSFSASLSYASISSSPFSSIFIVVFHLVFNHPFLFADIIFFFPSFLFSKF